eukprot:11212726-Alexandrium_andersonii.AAC.1
MSASLVGSEMCIRDRRPPLERFRAGGGGPRGARARCAQGPAGREGRGGAVSYTHLTLPTICSV